MSHSRRKNRDLNVRVVRVRLCKQIGVAEESVPMGRLSDFFKEHEPYARLPLDNPAVRVVKDSMPQAVVSVYGQVLKEKSVQSLDGIFYELAVEVAEKHKLVVWPKCAGEACAVAAYAMLESQKVCDSQCWSGSRLSPVQRSFSSEYLPVDFEFWSRYGSWSCCGHCGGWHFHDDCFKDLCRSSAVSEGLSRQVPSDPMEHRHGSVGIFSRWWYNGKMYKPRLWCHRCRLPLENFLMSSRHGGARTRRYQRLSICMSYRGSGRLTSP